MLEYAAFILALQFLRISKAHLLLLNLVLQIMCYFSTPNKLNFFSGKNFTLLGEQTKPSLSFIIKLSRSEKGPDIF